MTVITYQCLGSDDGSVMTMRKKMLTPPAEILSTSCMNWICEWRGFSMMCVLAANLVLLNECLQTWRRSTMQEMEVSGPSLSSGLHHAVSCVSELVYSLHEHYRAHRQMAKELFDQGGEAGAVRDGPFRVGLTEAALVLLEAMMGSVVVGNSALVETCPVLTAGTVAAGTIEEVDSTPVSDSAQKETNTGTVAAATSLATMADSAATQTSELATDEISISAKRRRVRKCRRGCVVT
jgi:hypothetical protein